MILVTGMKRVGLVCALWIGAGLLLTACAPSGESYHLRGAASAKRLEGKKIVLLNNSGNSELLTALQRSLQDMGATIVNAASDASQKLSIDKVNANRSVSGYSSTRAVSELKYTLEVDFTLTEVGTERTRSDSVVQMQTQAYDSNYVLGTQEDADQIQANMRREAARLIALKVAVF